MARLFWPAWLDDPCFVEDSSIGPHHRANCSAPFKDAETKTVTLRYNECGYRSSHSCKARLSRGAIRIVLIGSSDVMGYYTPYEQTFGVETEAKLRRYTGRPTEVQNLACDFLTPDDALKRLSEIVALHPRLVVYPVTANDIQHTGPQRWVRRRRITRFFANSRALAIGQHYLYGDKNLYVRQFLANSPISGFLRTPAPDTWKDHFSAADTALGRFADGLHAEGIPLLLMALPSEAETLILTSGEVLPGLEPHQFDRLVSGIAQRHGALYADAYPGFIQASKGRVFYYPVNAHMTPSAHRAIAEILTSAIEKFGLVPAQPRLN